MELLDTDGDVLAGSTGPAAADLSGLAYPVAEDPLLVGDFYRSIRAIRACGSFCRRPKWTTKGWPRISCASAANGPELTDSPLTSVQFRASRGAADTITVSSVEPGEDFLSQGFRAGQRLFVRGSAERHDQQRRRRTRSRP